MMPLLWLQLSKFTTSSIGSAHWTQSQGSAHWTQSSFNLNLQLKANIPKPFSRVRAKEKLMKCKLSKDWFSNKSSNHEQQFQTMVVVSVQPKTHEVHIGQAVVFT
jgi:hypothetical protein